MKETVYSQSGQNQKGVTVFGVLLVGLALSMLLFFEEWGYRWLSQSFVYLFGGGVIWVSVRYFFSAFVYEIVCYDGEWLLVISARQGKKTTTLCRMPLSQLQALTPLTHPANYVAPKEKPKQTFRFRQNMFPEATCWCRFDDGETTSALELEVDQAFWDILSHFLIPMTILNTNSEENENG